MKCECGVMENQHAKKLAEAVAKMGLPRAGVGNRLDLIIDDYWPGDTDELPDELQGARNAFVEAFERCEAEWCEKAKVK